jgi:hypothetical protein
MGHEGGEGGTMNATNPTILRLIAQVNDMRLVTIRNREPKPELRDARAALAHRLLRREPAPSAVR